MEQYEKFLNKIKEYFNYDEVVSEGSIISAYDLVCILNSRIEELYNLIYREKDLIKKIEKYYKTKNIPQYLLYKILRKSTPEVDFVRHSYKGGKSSIYIRFYPGTCYSVSYCHLRICKDLSNDELYFSDSKEIDRDFLEYFKEIILNNLQFLEEFYLIFQKTFPDISEFPDCDKSIIEQIDDEFLSLEIKYNTYGFFDYKISIVPSVDPDKVFNRVWLDHQSLEEYVLDHKEELLKRIPINILNLKATTQKIITDYYAKTNNQEQQLKLK